MKGAEWRARAICRGLDPDMFYPHSCDVNMARPEIRKVCDPCPVRTHCLEYGLKHERKGWWGGYSTNEIKRLRGMLRIRCHEPGLFTRLGDIETDEGDAALRKRLEKLAPAGDFLPAWAKSVNNDEDEDE